MAMTADSSSNQHSTGRKNLPSPWAQVVRGELDALSASDQPPSPMRQTSTPIDIETPGSPFSPPLASADEGQYAREGSDGSNGNAASAASKKTAWNKPSSSRTVVEADVMGDTLTWPALSEAIKSSPKLQSADPPVSGSNSSLQIQPAAVNLPKKSVFDTNHVNPTSVRKLNKNSNNGGSNGSNSSISTGFVQSNFTNPAPLVVPPPPPPPPFPILVGPNGYGNLMPPMLDPSVNQPYKGSTWEGRPGFMHHPHAMSHHRNYSRRGNFRSYPRSDSPSYRGGHGGRHDHGRGNYRVDRDVNMSMQRIGHRGGFVRTPLPNVVPFFPPHGVQTFGARPFPDFYYPGMHMEPYRAGGPFFPSAASVPMLIPQDLSLPILNQINYYFSDDNLVKDDHLKLQMDSEGWVHIDLIASFPRVKKLTSDKKLILQVMKSSTIVEVQGEKLRRRNSWKKWLIVPIHFSSENESSIGSTHTALASSFQKMTVEKTPLSEPITGPENNI